MVEGAQRVLVIHLSAPELGGLGDTCLYDKVVEDKNSNGAIEGMTSLCKNRLGLNSSE